MITATINDISNRGSLFIFSENTFNFVLNSNVCTLQEMSLKEDGIKS
jgi:hypothetical protein